MKEKYPIYPELNKQILLKRITFEQMSELMELSIPALVRKRNGTSYWRIEECKKLKEILEYEGTLDELFRI